MANFPLYWIDGRLVRANKATLPITDLAVTRGYAGFESLRTYDGVPFLLDAHLERFRETCRILSLQLRCSNARIRGVLAETLRANRHDESLIRIYLTGGVAKGFIPDGPGTLMILVDPMKPFAARQYDDGIRVATSRLARTFPLAKSTDYLAAVHDTIPARKLGFDEIAFVDGKGAILEGSTFSMAAIAGNTVITAEKDVLCGVTIEHLLKLAKRAGMRIRRKPISRADLRRCDELFITSSNREIIPVVRLDGRTIGDGRPGAGTRRLHDLYLRSVASHSLRHRDAWAHAVK